MDYFKEITCKKSGRIWKQYNSLQKCQCEICVAERKQNQKPKTNNKIYTIANRSKKRAEEERIYNQLVKVFVKGKICPVTKKPATECHHKKGRIGKLLLDTRYWLAVSREGHKWIEEHPIEAKEKGWSLSRLEVDNEQ